MISPAMHSPIRYALLPPLSSKYHTPKRIQLSSDTQIRTSHCFDILAMLLVRISNSSYRRLQPFPLSWKQRFKYLQPISSNHPTYCIHSFQHFFLRLFCPYDYAFSSKIHPDNAFDWSVPLPFCRRRGIPYVSHRLWRKTLLLLSTAFQKNSKKRKLFVIFYL